MNPYTQADLDRILAGWIFIVASVSLLVWFGHENARVGAGEWRPPLLIRRLLRFGNGPVYPSAVATEAWGLAMLFAGLLAQTGALDPSLAMRLLGATIYGAIPLGVVWGGLVLAHWLRSRQ